MIPFWVVEQPSVQPIKRPVIQPMNCPVFSGGWFPGSGVVDVALTVGP